MAKQLPKESALCFNVKMAWHAISRMYNQIGIPYDLSAASGFILLNIDPDQGTPVTHIGPAIGMEPKGLTRTLKSFEEKGWIVRESDPQDKRRVRVMLTEKGRLMRDVARDTVIGFNQSVFEKVSPEDLDAFYRVIGQIHLQARLHIHEINEPLNIHNP